MEVARDQHSTTPRRECQQQREDEEEGEEQQLQEEPRQQQQQEEEEEEEEYVSKRDRSLSPTKIVGNSTTINHSRKARRVEADNDVGKDARSRQQSENQDHGHGSRSTVSGRRHYDGAHQEDSRFHKEKESQTSSDRGKDAGVERNRARDRDKDFERDSYGKGREHNDWGRSRDKERNRDRERYRDKEKDRDRGKESNYRGRDYFSSDNDIRREKEKDKFRDRDREKNRVYRAAYNDPDELQDRDKYTSRYDYRGRDHYREKDAKKESERDRLRYKEDRKQKDLSAEKIDPVERDFSREDDVLERDKLKDGDEKVAVREYSSQRHTQVKEKLSTAKFGNASSRDTGDDKYHNKPNDIAERPSKEVFSSDRKEGKSKSQVLKDCLMNDLKIVPKAAGDGPDTDDQHSELKQDSKTKGSNLEANSLKSYKWGPESQLKSGKKSENVSAEDVANDLSTAKLAAMKAAELVNKNLGVAGFMSADQKKKLLWGSKKPQPDQETAVAAGTNRWDTVHFQDRGRQEKFNKLMGVKAESKADSSSQAKDEASLFTEEKQRELQQDLEKQFTAGLRRRDGRTVGLGL